MAKSSLWIRPLSSSTIQRFIGLRSRLRATSILGAILIGFSVGSISLIGFILLNMVQSELRQEATRRNTMLAASIAHEIAMTIDGYLRGLAILGEDPFHSKTGVEAIKRVYTAFEFIEVSDRTGRVKFNSEFSYSESFDLSKRDYFIATSRDNTHYISASFISERTYQPTAVLALSMDDSMIAGHLNLQSLSEYITGIDKQDYNISVIDKNGYYIANSRSDLVYRRETVALESWYPTARDTISGSRFHQKQGNEYFTSWASVNRGNWLVVISQTTGSIFTSANQLRRSTIGITLVFVFLSFAAIIIIIRIVAKDIYSLTRYTQQLAIGNYDVNLHYAGFADLAPLAENFETMFKAVRSREQNLKDTERQISENLREKEVLLKEIHHRVKNNLQLVISLLSLKAGANDELMDLFSDSIDRIRVMSMIHEMLYRSEDLAQIDLAEYIRTITEKLIENYTYKSTMPALSINLQPMTVDIDTAIPCGLIINELLTNSLKYAYPVSSGSLPQLAIWLKHDGDKNMELEIADNGPGLPDGITPQNSETLGMQLVLSLIDQLNGSWQINSNHGTVWKIIIPAKAAKTGQA